MTKHHVTQLIQILRRIIKTMQYNNAIATSIVIMYGVAMQMLSFIVHTTCYKFTL